MIGLRKEFEKLLGYKPHRKMRDEKMMDIIKAYLKKHPNLVVEVIPPPIDPVTEQENKETDAAKKDMEGLIPEQMDGVSSIIQKTPEQLEQEAIDEAMGTVPEFIPEPGEVTVTEEEVKEAQKANPDNPLMAAMALLLNSQTRTNELLEKMNTTLQKNSLPIGERVTPPEAIQNLKDADELAPLGAKKIYKVQILKVDLVATDGGQDRSESGQIFYSRAEADAFGQKYAPGATQDGKNRYRVYHETIILPPKSVEGEVAQY